MTLAELELAGSHGGVVKQVGVQGSFLGLEYLHYFFFCQGIGHFLGRVPVLYTYLVLIL